MILITYIFICIMYGSSNTAPQNDYFKGGSPLTDGQTSKVQLSEEPNLQRRFSSNLEYNGISTKLIPVIGKGKSFDYSKYLQSQQDQTEKLGQNEINFRNNQRKSSNARRKSKTKSRTVGDDTANIKNLFNKNTSPLEYFKKTFQISLDSKENPPELFRAKNLEKWRKKNMSHKTRMKNKGHAFKTSSRNFLKRPYKSEKRFIQKSKKRSSDLLSEESPLPLDTENFNSNSECQPLESLNLFQKSEFGNLFDSGSYKNCLLLRKDNKVELLIKNKEVASKFLGDAFNGDPFSVFQVMDRLPGSILYESEVPDVDINISNNIQMPFESLKNSDFLNIKTENYNFLPVDTYKLPMVESTEKVEPSNNDEVVANMLMSPNKFADINRFEQAEPKIEQRIYENLPVDQMPIKQSFKENFPSIQSWNSATVKDMKDNQNYIQIENKETQSKITFPINDTTSKKLLDASIKNLKFAPISQPEVPFSVANLNYMKKPKHQIFGSKTDNVPIIPYADFERTEFPNSQTLKEYFNHLKTPEKQIFGSKIGNVPLIPNASFQRTGFPNNQAKEEASNYVKTTEKQMFSNEMDIVPMQSSAGLLITKFPNKESAEINENLYSSSQTASANARPPKFENKEKQPENLFSTKKPKTILPTLMYKSPLKPEPLETVTNATQTEQPVNQTSTSALFDINTGDIHIVITEPFVTQAIPEAITVNENNESDYNVKNPPVGISQNEEIPETDIKMLKMHYRRPHVTIEPNIRHRRRHHKTSN